ncbi:MAG: hypothetical protein C4331_16675, partial [Meiothermus sp.]
MFGGLGCALYILATIPLFPRLGAVLSVELMIAGQMLASFLLDTFGLLGGDRQTGEPRDGTGAIGGVGGVFAIVRGQSAQGMLSRWSLTLLALAAGAVLPVQGAINAQLRHD